jgi:hypothetical protein
MKVLGLSAALAVGLTTVAFADHVEPVVYGDAEGEDNNPSCAELDPSWNEVKVNQAPNGDYPDSGGGENPGGEGPLVFTVENSDGKVFDWKSNIGVDAVVVKGGNRGANVYFYDPEEKADQRLRSPDNTQGNVPAVSHISACYDVEETRDEPGGGDQQQDQPQDEGGGEQQEEQPQDEGDGRGEDQGGNQRPAEPDEPQDDQPQDNADDEDEPGDQGGGNERPAEGEEPQQDGGTDEGEEESARDERAADEEGESEVEGVSETDDGEANDVAEETDSDSDDELPFTGAPLGIVLLLGTALMLAGVAGRIVTR